MMRNTVLLWRARFHLTISSGTATPKFFEGQEEGSESKGNEPSLLWPTLSQAWPSLKGSLEKAHRQDEQPSQYLYSLWEHGCLVQQEAAQAIYLKAG